MHPSSAGRTRRSKHGWAMALGLALILLAFRNVDTRGIATLLSKLGYRVWLVPIPFALGQMTETLAWKSLFDRVRTRVTYGRLLKIRLACEGITATCPGGVLVAESVKPGLLMRHFGLAPEQAICGTAGRKLLLLVAQCFYFGIAALLGIPALYSVARTKENGWWLSAAVVLAFLVLLLAATAAVLLLSRNDLCDRLRVAFSHFPIVRLRHALDRAQGAFKKTDHRLREFCALGWRRLALPTGLYLAAWFFEALETIALLTLLGVPLDIRTLLLIEVCASMVRNIAFLSPSGLGVQDLSYAGLLQIFSVPNALSVAAAFLLLKRAKELLWSLLGYGLLSGLMSERSEQEVRVDEAAVALSP